MRNLKRVLSLALASVMLLGMMVIGAGAADKVTYDKLTDKDKITNKEAVSLMVDLGIIVGKPDGTYAPAEVVDRATMAKLITYVQMGDVDQAIFKGTKTDLKDVDGTWAEGYIKYCYANGIITGDGIGHFFPTQSVSVVAAAKMLLVALGYDPNGSGYVNDSMWSVNIMKDAQSAGLLAGIAQTSADGLTRDNAARMIYNALMAKTVKAEYQYDMGVKYLSKYVQNTDTLGKQTYNLVKVASAVLSINEFNGSTSKGYSVIGGNTVPVVTALADVGKNVYYYTFNKDGKTAYSSTAFVDGNVKTYAVPAGLVASVDGTKKLVSTWLTENGLTVAAGTTTKIANYVIDGTPYANAAAVNAALIVTADKNAYVIDNNKDGVIDALVINSQAVKVLTGDVKTATSNGATTVYVPNVTTGYVSKVVGYEGLKKDDVVMVMTVNASTYIEKATSFTGKITGFNASKNSVTVDGTSYDVSSMSGGFTSYANYTDLGYTQTITFYKDANGKLIYATAPEAAASNYGVVLGFESSVISNTNGTALLLTAEGEQKTVKVATTSTATLTGATDPQNASTFVYVSYTVNDAGEYVFTAPKSASVSDTINNAYITKNSANYIMGSGASTGGYAGNANTVFLVAKIDSTTHKITGYTAFKGIANAPSYSGTAAGKVVYGSDNIAKLVVITAGTETYAGTGSFFYAEDIANATYDASAKTYKVSAFLNGVKQDVVVKSAVYSAMSSTTLYAVTVTDGIVTGATSQAYTASNKIGVKYSGGTLIAGTSETAPAYLPVADDATIFLKDGSTLTTITASSIVTDTNDKISYLTNSSGKVIVAFIEKVAATDLTAAALKSADTYTTGSDVNLLANAGVNAADKKATLNDKLSIRVTAAAGTQITVTVNGTSVTKVVAVGSTYADFNAIYTVTATDVAIGNGSVVYTVKIVAGDGDVNTTATYTVKNIT